MRNGERADGLNNHLFTARSLRPLRGLTGCFPKDRLWKVSEFENSELDIKNKKFLSRLQIRELFSEWSGQRIRKHEKDECRLAVQHAHATKGGSMPSSILDLFSAGGRAAASAAQTAFPRLTNSCAHSQNMPFSCLKLPSQFLAASLGLEHLEATGFPLAHPQFRRWEIEHTTSLACVSLQATKLEESARKQNQKLAALGRALAAFQTASPTK